MGLICRLLLVFLAKYALISIRSEIVAENLINSELSNFYPTAHNFFLNFYFVNFRVEHFKTLLNTSPLLLFHLHKSVSCWRYVNSWWKLRKIFQICSCQHPERKVFLLCFHFTVFNFSPQKEIPKQNYVMFNKFFITACHLSSTKYLEKPQWKFYSLNFSSSSILLEVFYIFSIFL